MICLLVLSLTYLECVGVGVFLFATERVKGYDSPVYLFSNIGAYIIDRRT